MPDFYNMLTEDILCWLQHNPADSTIALDELLRRCGAAILTDLERIGYTFATPCVESAFDRHRAWLAAQRLPPDRLRSIPDNFFTKNKTRQY
jgi:hypothetical protein